MALSRGMIAVGAGDARAAAKHAADAGRLIAHEPMTKLLRAQAAQLAGDRARRHRGLQRDARCITRRTGSACAACISRRAGAATTRLRCNTRCAPTRMRPPLGRGRRCWTTAPGAATGRARSRPSNSNAAARLIDKPTANRWRAVIKTAMAEETMERDPKARAGAGAGGLPSCADARSRRGDLRPADGGRRRLPPRGEDSRERLCADAASRPRRRLFAGSPWRIRPPTGSRAPARWRASRRTIPESMLTDRPRGARGA